MRVDRNSPNTHMQDTQIGHYLKYNKGKTTGKDEYKTLANLNIKSRDLATYRKQRLKQLTVNLS